MNNYPKQRELKLNWHGGKPGIWHQLTDPQMYDDIPEDIVGVYVIWEQLTPSHINVIKVGQGIIKDRLSVHRNDDEIIGDGSSLHMIFVAWAEVAPDMINGVEAFLGRHLKPEVGDRFPKDEEVLVNFPF